MPANLVGKLQRHIERLFVVIECKRIVAIEVWVGGEQEDELADREMRSVNLHEHFGEAERVRRLGPPGQRRRVGIEAGEQRQGLEVFGEELDEFGTALVMIATARAMLDVM